MIELPIVAVSSAGMAEFRKNWTVVLATMIGFALSQIHLYSLGVMIGPLEHSFGWSRTNISSGLLIVSIVVFPLAPLMGRAVDRFGPRRIALLGTTLYCGSVAALALAQPPVWTWWLLWLLVAFGNVFLTPTIWIAAISSLFDASRGLALALAMSGSGLVSLGAPVLTNVLVAHFGWRTAYAVLGGLAAAIMLPILYMFFSSAADQGRVAGPNPVQGPASGTTGLTIAEALRSPPFLKLAVTGFLLSIMTMSVLVNLIPILSSLGIDRSNAPALAGVVGITQIMGRLAGGFLLDRFNARLVGSVTVLFPLLSCMMLLIAGGSAIVAAAAILIFGLTVGAEIDVIAYLTGRFVGMRNFGVLFGAIIALLTLGTGLGPVCASLIYDLTKSYGIVLWVVLVLSLSTSLMLLNLGPYPVFGEKTADERHRPNA